MHMETQSQTNFNSGDLDPEKMGKYPQSQKGNKRKFNPFGTLRQNIVDKVNLLEEDQRKKSKRNGTGLDDEYQDYKTVAVGSERKAY